MISKISITLLLFIFSFQVNAQKENNNWAFSVDLALAKYSDADSKALNETSIVQFPRLSVARYMSHNLILGGAFSAAFGNQKYTTFDVFSRYDFGTSEQIFVPYIVAGTSFIMAEEITPTVNAGLGSTLWFFENYGLKLQALYKFSGEQFSSQRSHTMFSAGFVFNFGKTQKTIVGWNR
jgi:hypothetical protein